MSQTVRRASFTELASARRSVRSYLPTPVSPEALERILRAANAAPSGGNLQAYEVVVVESPLTRRELAGASHGQQQVADAPVVLAFCADPDRARTKYGRRGAELYSVQDATIACAYAQLAATELGLGTCWVGAFDGEVAAHVLHVPPPAHPVVLLTVGHAAEAPDATPRRPLADLARLERFDSPRPSSA